MKRTLRNRLTLVVAALVIIASGLLSVTQHAAAVGDNGYLIDDAIFYDKSTMSVAQITSFIGRYPNSCLLPANYPSGISWATFREPLGYFDYGTTDVSPAQIIWKVSQLYNINPQVILSTLEKEQSLVSGSAGCATWKYNSSMGYNCPDSGGLYSYSSLGITNTCVQKEIHVTFSRQVNHAAWQLSFDGKRANGDLSWMGDGATYYYGRMTQGDRARVEGGSTTPYDGYTTIDNTAVYLRNGASAALYNYTPHFNSFNAIFTNWFGSAYVLTYSAKPVYQSSHVTAFPGDTAPMTVRYQNNGSASWYDDFTAWNANKPVVKLGTDGPLNRSSAFGSGWRWGPTRASDVFSAVYEADGVTKASNQHIVLPGQIGEFSFNLTVPRNITPANYQEAFRPIVEGGTSIPGDGVWWNVNVQKPTYTAQPAGQSYYPRLAQGESAPAYFRYKNTGNVSWYDDFTAWNANKPVVKLGTDGPLNRSSAFGSGWRWGPTRASDVFSAVYEADGVTKASNQHIVLPGQIGEFSFTFKSTMNTTPGTYNEGFRPIVEGVGEMNAVGTWLGVTVAGANYSAAPVAQSYYPTIKQGQSAPAYFSFKNTGNVAWYDDFTAWNAGQMPVKLGTNNPLNRSSVFGSSWRWGPTRASDVFAAVYEADGVTLTSNQHVVMPGQIGRFDFTFTVPATLAPGYYPEAFLPIVEGYTVMNVSGGPWLGVTVIR